MLYNLPEENVKEFITAGKAIVTLESGKTGKRYTYQINKSKDSNIYFVSLFTGNNNEKDYSYLCYFRNIDDVKFSNKSIMSSNAEPSKAFTYFMRKLNAIPENLHVYHSGKCGRCGRTLTTPESIKRGLGPECCKFVI